MDEKEIKALVRSIERIMGNPIEADEQEIDALFAEFGDGKNPTQSVFDLASRAAQKYRLEGESVPTHVAQALDFAKQSLSGERLDAESPASVIDNALSPILGPVREVSQAFRNRRGRTEKDSDLLEMLSTEVKKDWSKDKEK